MRIPLESPLRKFAVLGGAGLFAAALIALAAAQFAAARFSEKSDLANLERAVRLQPGNGDFRYRLGLYHSLLQESDAAAESFRAAVWLNPNKAAYWLELAKTYQTLDDIDSQRNALEHAVRAEPTNPQVAWEAANSFLVQGRMENALDEFRVVLANDTYRASAAMQLCWRIRPDVDLFLRRLLPPNAGSQLAFLSLLISKKESAAAAKVWAHIVVLKQPVAKRSVFSYVQYLITEQDVDQARLVWQQAAPLAELTDYQPTAANLVVNGDFALPVLNGGFDWTYFKPLGVILALDPTQPHTGHQSLFIGFDKAMISDAGMRQIVPVRPNTRYEFSAYFKSEDMDGAGGMRFALLDAFDGALYFGSEELKGADFWKEAGGTFTTGPNTKLLILLIQRVPSGSPIKGKLWIDGVRLRQSQEGY